MFSAIWRLSSLFANERGPLAVFERIRRGILRMRIKNRRLRALGASFYEGLTCEWCNSIWFAVLMVAAWDRFGGVILLVVLPLALSAWAIAFKYILHLIRNAEEYLYKLKTVESPRWVGGVDFGMGDKSAIFMYDKEKGINNVRKQ